MRRQFLLPVNRPVITIEVGGTKVVSDLLRSAKINPLFEKRLKYVDLVRHRKYLCMPLTDTAIDSTSALQLIDVIKLLSSCTHSND